MALVLVQNFKNSTRVFKKCNLTANNFVHFPKGKYIVTLWKQMLAATCCIQVTISTICNVLYWHQHYHTLSKLPFLAKQESAATLLLCHCASKWRWNLYVAVSEKSNNNNNNNINKNSAVRFPHSGTQYGFGWGNGKYKTKKNQKIKRKITLLCKVSKSARFSFIAPGLHVIRNLLREPSNHIAVELSILLLNQAIVFVFPRVFLPD